MFNLPIASLALRSHRLIMASGRNTLIDQKDLTPSALTSHLNHLASPAPLSAAEKALAEVREAEAAEAKRTALDPEAENRRKQAIVGLAGAMKMQGGVKEALEKVAQRSDDGWAVILVSLSLDMTAAAVPTLPIKLYRLICRSQLRSGFSGSLMLTGNPKQRHLRPLSRHFRSLHPFPSRVQSPTQEPLLHILLVPYSPSARIARHALGRQDLEVPIACCIW